MATPIKERMRKMRERLQAEGMVRVEVTLPRELLDKCRLPGETINACLQRALLQSVSGNRVKGVSTQERSLVSGNKSLVMEKKSSRSVSGNTQERGQQRSRVVMPVSGDSRDTIINWLIVAKDAMRLSYQKIADALNAQGVPTFSGKGQWQKGNVERFYKGKTD